MTPDELDRYLAVTRKHGGTLFKMGDVEVRLGGQPAPVELPAVPFVPGGAPDKPTLPTPGGGSDPVKRWDAVDAMLFGGEGQQA